MASRLSKLSLEELYSQPKCSPGVWLQITEKEKFDSVNPKFCQFACSLPSKDLGSAVLTTTSTRPVDILFVHSHIPLNEKFKTGTELEEIYKRIISASFPSDKRAASYSIQHVHAYKCPQKDLKDATVPRVRSCAQYLHYEISVLKPRVIVALGGLAAKALNLPTSGGGRGRIQSYCGIPVVTTLEPRILCMVRQNSSGDLWGPDYKTLLNLDIGKALWILEHGMPKSFEMAFKEATTPPFFRVIQSVDEGRRALQYLSRFPWVSFDIETTGLDPWAPNAKILTAQFSDPPASVAVVFPLWHREWSGYDANVMWKDIAAFLAGPVLKVGHNVAFDALYVQVTKGIRPSPVNDTMQYLHSIDSGLQGSYDLKTATCDYLFETGLSGYEDQLPPLKAGQTYEDYPFGDLLKYAGIDGVVTSKLKQKLDPVLDAPIIQRNYTNLEPGGSAYKQYPPIRKEIETVKDKALSFLLDLEYVGIGYSAERNRNMHHKIEAEVKALTSDIGESFNLDSAEQLSEYLFKRKGYETENKTKSGVFSTDGDTLRELSEKYNDPIPALIAKRSELKTIDDTFLKDYLKWVSSDGRIHPTYNLHGTSSFRITGNNPNLTQLANDKHGYSVRSCYIATEGMFFGAADYSSAEVKILAAISRDPQLLQACREGKDFHSYTAARILGIPYEEFISVVEDEKHILYKKYKKKRKDAKAITFSILYGSSMWSVSQALGISLSQTEDLFNLYFREYPGIKDYIEVTHREAKYNAFILTAFNQVRREYGLLPAFKGTAVYNAGLRNAQNVKIQSSASTLGLLAFANLNNLLKDIGGRAICTVYDSIEFEAPLGREKEATEIILYALDEWPQQQFPWLDFKIGVDIEIGPSWGEAKKVDLKNFYSAV